MEHPQFGYDPAEGVLLIGQTAIDIHIEAGGQSVPLPELLTNPAAASCDRQPPLRADRDRDNLVRYSERAITAGDVENVASMLGIYDDLFTQDYSYLRIA